MTTTKTRRDRRLFLHEIFTTAMEGGVQYWAGVQAYRWMIPAAEGTPDTHQEDVDGFHAILVPDADEGEWGVWDGAKDKEPLTVDINVMRLGVTLFTGYCNGEFDSQGNRIAADSRKPLRKDHYWQQFLLADRTNGEDGDYDAEVAEQIVQWGLFGQGIYG